MAVTILLIMWVLRNGALHRRRNNINEDLKKKNETRLSKTSNKTTKEHCSSPAGLQI